MKTVGYIYKTTNTVNGKIYIGQHQAHYSNKTYLGSGTIFKKAVKKYGKESFKKEVLRKCKTLHEMSVWEHVYIVKYNSTDLKVGYNIAMGDVNTSEYNPMKMPGPRKKLREYIKSKGGYIGKNNPAYGISWSEEARSNLSKSLKETYKKNGHSRIGTKHTDESKEIMRQKKIGVYEGKNNPAYGKPFEWINNGINNKKGSIKEPIPKGWVKGYIQKKK